MKGKVRVGKLDIDESPGVATKLGIKSIPTLVVFKGGKESARHVGATNKDALVRLIGAGDAGEHPACGPAERRADSPKGTSA